MGVSEREREIDREKETERIRERENQRECKRRKESKSKRERKWDMVNPVKRIGMEEKKKEEGEKDEKCNLK